MIVIGIDPGITGALSLFLNGRLTDICDMPAVVTVKASKGSDIRDLIGGASEHKRAVIDKPKLAEVLRDWSHAPAQGPIVVWREKVGPRPNQGIVSSSRFLEVVGVIDGICAALGMELRPVEPSLWKRMTGTPTSKKDACKHAAEVFPQWASYFRRTSIDHNRAEAALIGLYGVRHG